MGFKRDFSRETFPPINFFPFPPPIFCFGEKFLGGKFMFPKGLGRENLPEIIDLSRIPRATNKKSMVSGTFGKSFISGIPGSLNYLRNLEIWTNLGNLDTAENFPPKNISPPRNFSPEELFPKTLFFPGKVYRGKVSVFKRSCLRKSHRNH